MAVGPVPRPFFLGVEKLKIKPSFSEFEEMAQQGNLLPVYQEFLADTETPVSAYLKLKDGSYSYLLESAANGKSGVCLINKEQVTLKKFFIEKSGIRLQPANTEMEPIFLKNEEVQILGVVSGVVRTFT